jgi:sugar/nucleoside kinase (ribokinase family)
VPTPLPAHPDLILVGHLARDLTPGGERLGGTAAYAGLTAHALGRRVGLLTAADPGLDLSPLAGLTIHVVPSTRSTTFENRYTAAGRQQILHARAVPLRVEDVPPAWRDVKHVHLAPIANEIDPAMLAAFPGSRVYLTPQGWLRRWDAEGVVRLESWEALLPFLAGASALVLSLEDLGGDEGAIDPLARHCPIVAVTRGARGATVAAQGQVHHLPAPAMVELDPTGAGDVFAAAFFVSLAAGMDAWEAGRRANLLASHSVGGVGLGGVPAPVDCEILLARAQA